MNHTHLWNWHPNWDVVQKIYHVFPESYSVLTPFAFSYLEELIRSTTSEYGIQIYDKSGNPKKRKVGMALIKLAIEENKDHNSELVSLLEEMKAYFKLSQPIDRGDNRNSVAHGFMHSRYWERTSFERLIHDISLISKHARF